MRRINHFLLILLFCFYVFGLFAQSNQEPFLVKFKPHVDIEAWQEQHLSQENTTLHYEHIIIERFNLGLFSFDKNRLTFPEVKTILLADKNILWAGLSTVNVQSRTTPNDPDFSSQWGLQEIDAADFWAITTGGTTFNSDTIVVAIMEGGTALNHPDLVDNIWHNYQEIPGDGIDNDNNGFIDDFTGWNSVSQNDAHIYNKHGAEVTGVIGAKGNNSKGITGVNWNVKLMPITFLKNNITTYFLAFDYLIEQRKLYNETDGEKGAFIVAVNESFGQENTKPEDDPTWNQWCEYIDALGEVGILTIGATSNHNKNVDLVGDMPTTCPQDYLIAVTGVDALDTRSGAYGPEHIDLAAPSRDILTTLGPGDTYQTIGGTSIAAPHLAGAIALIYSYPCSKWADYIQLEPAKAALLVKKWLLESTKSISTLTDKIVSSGSLNIKNIIPKLELFCLGNQLEPLAFRIQPNLTNGLVHFEYDVPRFGPIKIQIYNALGQLVCTKSLEATISGTQTGTIETNLLPVGMYIFSLTHEGQKVAQRVVKY